jgi:hypothetical protein
MNGICTVCDEPYDTKHITDSITLTAAGRDVTWCVAAGQVGSVVVYEHSV